MKPPFKHTLYPLMLLIAIGAMFILPSFNSGTVSEDDRSVRTYESFLDAVDTATTTTVVAWDNQSTERGTITWYCDAAHVTASRSVVIIHQEAVDFDKTVWFTIDTIAVIAQNGNYKGKNEYNLTGRAARLLVKSDASTVPLTAGDFGFVFKPWE